MRVEQAPRSCQYEAIDKILWSSVNLFSNKILALIKSPNSGTNVRRMLCNNPNLDLVTMNAFIKKGEILKILSRNEILV